MLLQRLVVGCLLLLYISAMLKPICPYLEYALNKDYISQALCINQGKPELACEGKCYLMQKIKEQESRSDIPKNCLEEELNPEHIANPFYKYAGESDLDSVFDSMPLCVRSAISFPPPSPPPRLK